MACTGQGHLLVRRGFAKNQCILPIEEATPGSSGPVLGEGPSRRVPLPRLMFLLSTGLNLTTPGPPVLTPVGSQALVQLDPLLLQ